MAAGLRLTVLLEIWDRPIYTIGGRHLISDALRLCGAHNIFADLNDAAPVVDVEAVIARDPDMIIAAAPVGGAAAWLAEWRRIHGFAGRAHRPARCIRGSAPDGPGSERACGDRGPV